MRPLVTLGVLVASASVLSAACAGPHSTGALWARQNLEQEHALFQQTDTQRASLAQAFELGLADESLQAERQRITTELQNCPGPSQGLGVSAGDSVRDTIRIRSQSDPGRLAEVSHLALADWYSRRAGATGNASLCERAQAALSGSLAADSPSADPLRGVPAATVSRDQRAPDGSPQPLTSDQPLTTLSAYALGAVDSVHAPAPLPQYLARVYGGFLSPDSPAFVDTETAASLVDRGAPAYPDWEPDALYAALRGSRA